MFRLVAYAPDGVRRFPVPGASCSSAAGPSATSTCPYTGVAQQHAVLRYDGSELRIEDLGTRKGLLVSGRKVREAVAGGAGRDPRRRRDPPGRGRRAGAGEGAARRRRRRRPDGTPRITARAHDRAPEPHQRVGARRHREPHHLRGPGRATCWRTSAAASSSCSQGEVEEAGLKLVVTHRSGLAGERRAADGAAPGAPRDAGSSLERGGVLPGRARPARRPGSATTPSRALDRDLHPDRRASRTSIREALVAGRLASAPWATCWCSAWSITWAGTSRSCRAIRASRT